MSSPLPNRRSPHSPARALLRRVWLRAWRRCAGALLAAFALPACAPTWDWRTVQLPGTQLLTELPCRPGRFQREVVVAGAPLTLFMLSCEAGGVTYGIASAEVGDPAQVDPVLHALSNAARAAIRSSGSSFAALSLDGITPFSGNGRARLRGTRPDGQSVDESISVFARGLRVFQACAIGPVLPDAARLPFEEGLRFDLAQAQGDAG